MVPHKIKLEKKNNISFNKINLKEFFLKIFLHNQPMLTAHNINAIIIILETIKQDLKK